MFSSYLYIGRKLLVLSLARGRVASGMWSVYARHSTAVVMLLVIAHYTFCLSSYRPSQLARKEAGSKGDLGPWLGATSMRLLR